MTCASSGAGAEPQFKRARKRAEARRMRPRGGIGQPHSCPAHLAFIASAASVAVVPRRPQRGAGGT
jgi:hypothetical protein